MLFKSSSVIILMLDHISKAPWVGDGIKYHFVCVLFKSKSESLISLHQMPFKRKSMQHSLLSPTIIIWIVKCLFMNQLGSVSLGNGSHGSSGVGWIQWTCPSVWVFHMGLFLWCVPFRGVGKGRPGGYFQSVSLILANGTTNPQCALYIHKMSYAHWWICIQQLFVRVHHLYRTILSQNVLKNKTKNIEEKKNQKQCRMWMWRGMQCLKSVTINPFVIEEKKTFITPVLKTKKKRFLHVIFESVYKMWKIVKFLLTW